MKKLFLSLMLVAAVATAFVGCKKNASESDTHSQSFTLGETTYSVDNSVTIENIQYNDKQIYNAIVLSTGQMIGDNSGEGQSIVIVFRGNFTAGTYNLSTNLESFPKYFFGELEVEDIVNFSIDDLMEQEGVYMANSGSFTLEMDGDFFTITTDGVEVEKIKDPAIVETSSADYEGDMLRYVLARVEEGTLNEANIVTAGRTEYKLWFIDTQIVAFITEEGDMLGFTSSTPFTDGVPTGEFTNDDYLIILVEDMNIKAPKPATSGNINISKDGETYTIDITGVEFNGVEDTYSMHYVGTMPYFDFPF